MARVINYFIFAVIILFWAVVFLASVGVVDSWSMMDPSDTTYIEDTIE